jgi:hypothetical protein
MKKQNLYSEFKTRAEKRISDFDHLFFAFSKQQFDEGMKRIGLDPQFPSLVTCVNNCGFVDKTYLGKWENINRITLEELERGMNDDAFLYDAFLYELGNHEFIITYDLSDTLDVFGLTMETMTEQQRIILLKAKQDYLLTAEA